MKLLQQWKQIGIMPKKLVPLTIQAPGFFGLRTQQKGDILPPGWATVLENIVFDDVGRIASRKGTKQLNGTVVTSSPTIRQVHEYIDNAGATLTIFAADNKIYKEVSGTMTDISGTITTPTADSWQFTNFNDWCVGFQTGHAPIVITSTAGSFADSGGTQYNGDMVLAMGGRLWTVLDSTLYYSDLLINNFTGGSSGTFDLAKFWPNGMDEAVALADFNGFLVVFGKNSIIIYENADDVANMTIVEGINGIGCIARDSVQVVGTDIMFLSNTGVRSLGRVIQEKSMPITDVSKNVRDELVSRAVTETATNIKSVYHPTDGFYLLSLPTAGYSYYFDLKFPNPDGSLKVATWDVAPTAMNYTQGRVTNVAVTAGYLSTYTAYMDEDDNTGANGNTYTCTYESAWNDLGEEVGNYLKIPKSFSVLASGTPSVDVTFKWAYDYEDVFYTKPLAYQGEAPAQYGIAQYGVDTYSSMGTFERKRGSMTHTGQVLKVGVTFEIEDFSFAIQRIDVLSKLGRLAL